jgi:transposase
MLSYEQRAAILELHRQKVSRRQIARTLKISKATVKKVIRSASATPPPIERPEKAAPFRQEILDLHASCKGNLQRVHEELIAMGANLSYQALTGYCRRHEIGTKEKRPCGEYHFRPGEETQHDTSPHRVAVAGRQRAAQTASAALCYSHMLFFQCYPSFDRFTCKVFLTEALRYLEGATERMMIDNTHVVVLHGTGAGMVPVPEMAAFGDRFGFTFAAHEKGDANRSARVERPFHFIENNFLAGRTFASWQDLNKQARAWCDKVNASYKKHLRARPVELYATEKPHLKPLPVWIPDPYLLHHRIVDSKGYVNLHNNRYSVPIDWIGRQVEVQETWAEATITLDPRKRVVHQRAVDGVNQTISSPEHRPRRGAPRPQANRDEELLIALRPEIAGYVRALKKHGKKQVTLALRQLLRMAREYPREPFLAALAEAAHFGLYELDRVERMVIRRIGSDYFRLKDFDNNSGGNHDR